MDSDNSNNLENVLKTCGVTRDNIFTNLFIYSMFASQNLDFLASAAGKVDIEAARHIRMAQQIIRTRIDILFRQSFFGDGEFKAIGSFEPFGEIEIATSEDAGQAFKADSDEIINDLEKFFHGVSDCGDRIKMEGPIFDNLRRIMVAEEKFYHCDLQSIFKTETEEQDFIIKNLQIAAATVLLCLYDAIELLRNKFLFTTCGNTGRLVCSSCGSLMLSIENDEESGPALCPVCGAPASMIIECKFNNSPALDEIYNKLKYNL